MNKPVLRYGEVTLEEGKVLLAAPTSYPELAHLLDVDDEQEEQEDDDVYHGPTAEDLRREAEEFRAQWEIEKEAMLSSAKLEAEQIIKDAEEAAGIEVKRLTEEGEAFKQNAQLEAEKIIADANVNALQIEEEVRATLDAERKSSNEEGRNTGLETGFEEGKAEVERLVQRTHTVLERAQDKRVDILEDTEREIVNLVLLISRKVVKAITEAQKNVVVQNVVQALRKVKGRGNIIIRVNLADLKLTTAHTNDFINMLEGNKNIQVQEDSSVDEGGCIIETDFGEIDARIASQLAELEAKILEVSPIKSTQKPAPKQVDRSLDRPALNGKASNG
ncbi:MAG: flagellar assembly protein FliH [Treponema sp.]|nr:flagellar assembly protein FliH [Treponema sp.]